MLANASKGTSSIADYFAKIMGLAEDMASAGRKLEDEELVSYILAGLGADYNPVVSDIATQVEPITPSELYTQLVSFDEHMELRGGGTNVSVNMVAKRGRSGGNFSNPQQNRGGGGRGGGGHGGHGRSGGGRGPNF